MSVLLAGESHLKPPSRKPKSEKLVVVSKGSFHHLVVGSLSLVCGPVDWGVSAMGFLPYMNSGLTAFIASSINGVGYMPRNMVPTAVQNRTIL